MSLSNGSVEARITLSGLSGTWRDAGGNTGVFAFGAATGGPLRPTVMPGSGDITGVTAGTGLTGGGNSGDDLAGGEPGGGAEPCHHGVSFGAGPARVQHRRCLERRGWQQRASPEHHGQRPPHASVDRSRWSDRDGHQRPSGRAAGRRRREGRHGRHQRVPQELQRGLIMGSCSSDARFKREVTAFAPSLDRVAALSPVHYFWRAEAYPDKGAAIEARLKP